MIRGRFILAAPLLVVACSSDGGSSHTTYAPFDGGPLTTSPPSDQTPPDSGGPAADAGSFDAGPPPVLANCPTTGKSAYTAPDANCYEFSAVDTGASADGQNPTDPETAVRSTATVPASLMLFFIGSGGEPAHVLNAGPVRNFYAAAVATGHAALGITYRNDDSIGSLCDHDDACFFPTRQSIITGAAIAGSKVTVRPDESIVGRTARALRYLAAGDPTGGWSAFLTTQDPAADPVTAIVWSKIVAAGHSQGGGHAAAIGKLFPVTRVIQLSSTCDNVDGAAATWTSSANGPWASDPTMFWGLATPSTDNGDGTFSGDSTCPFHTKSWTSEGMKTNHRNNFAEDCGDTGDTHGESLKCKDNYPTWVSMLSP